MNGLVRDAWARCNDCKHYKNGRCWEYDYIVEDFSDAIDCELYEKKEKIEEVK